MLCLHILVPLNKVVSADYFVLITHFNASLLEVHLLPLCGSQFIDLTTLVVTVGDGLLLS